MLCYHMPSCKINNFSLSPYIKFTKIQCATDNKNVGLIFLSTLSIEDFLFQVEIAMLKLNVYFVFNLCLYLLKRFPKGVVEIVFECVKEGL